MAATLSKCLGLTRLSSNGCRKPAWNGKITANHCWPAYYPLRIPVVQRLWPATSIVGEDFTAIKHMENIVKVKGNLMQVDDPLESMIIVDYLQRLGIDYQFREEIESMLGSLYQNVSHDADGNITEDLFRVTLSFRLLRQAGYPISSDIISKFMDQKENFKSTLRTDVPALLSLYEASQMNTGEVVLDKAEEFSSKHLAACVKYLEPNLARLVSHTLKHPCQKTISRYNARHYLDYCQTENGTRGVLEELARFDFNLVQSLHQKELNEIVSWWNSTGMADELKFVRNQPLKWYAWPMTMLHEPQFSKWRIKMAKVIAFIYIIDDIFDVYGSLEELDLFTDAVSKWELSILDTLPAYMQVCYKALYTFITEIAEAIFKEQGWNPTNSLKKSWTTLCNVFLIESRWLRSKNIPKPDEYLRNAVISAGVPTVLTHSFFLLGQGITKENVDILEETPPLFSYTATLLRLWDDLGSAKDEKQEGFDGSYVECYMNEFQCSNKDARDHVKELISMTWKNLNKECLQRHHFAPNIVAASLNIARMVEVMYGYDDNQNLPLLEDYISGLLFRRL